MRIYLSGAIEYAPDHGRHWRSTLAPFLARLGHEVYDPALDEKKNLEAEEMAHFREWKRSDLARFQTTLRKIIDYDLDWIEQRTDAIVCYWDEHCSKGAGTQAELTFAYRLGLPVYLVTEMPAEKISGWILGCSSRIFRNMEELQAHFAESLSPQEVRSE
ncbi:MAG TPA: nucleoside 2-deoxyribosyltransferase [Terriglobales bacterium]|nr:nucleoside 2-deoxyribosyltransferase [Terriglobales bacterium]